MKDGAKVLMLLIF